MIIKSSCLVVLFTFAALIVNSVFIHARAEKLKPPNKQQQEAIAEFQENKKFQNQPVCHQPLTVMIGGEELVLPRIPMSIYTTKDNKKYEYMDRRCEIHYLDNIASVRMFGGLEILDAQSLSENNSSSYRAYLKDIDISRKEGLFNKLGNGIERLGHGNSAIYVVPPDLIPTFGEDPASFICTTGWKMGDPDLLDGASSCFVKYRYNEHLSVAYDFFKSEPPKPTPELILQVDAKVRSEIESYLKLKK